jgi:hypothetical protein
MIMAAQMQSTPAPPRPLARWQREQFAALKGRLRESRKDAIADQVAASHGKMSENRYRASKGHFETELAVMAEDHAVAHAGVVRRRAKPPLDRHVARDEITGPQWEAGTRLKRDYEAGVIGLSTLSRIEIGRIEGTGAGRLIADRKFRAMRSYRRAIAAMGEHALVVLPVVVGGPDGSEISVEKVATLLGRNRKKLMVSFRTGLDRLVDFYEIAKRRR